MNVPAMQRLIAELRRKVQEHVGRLSRNVHRQLAPSDPHWVLSMVSPSNFNQLALERTLASDRLWPRAANQRGRPSGWEHQVVEIGVHIDIEVMNRIEHGLVETALARCVSPQGFVNS